MLHITHPSSSHHKKAITCEIFVSVAMLAIFFVPASKASDITTDMIIKLTNNARQVANVAILKENEMLQKAAEQKAQDMIDNDYFAHVSPVGKSPWDWISKNDYDYRYAGENLAINFTNAEAEQKAWMESPLHRKNILNNKYQEIGVAVKQGIVDGRETTVVVQMFGTQMKQAVASENFFSPKNDQLLSESGSNSSPNFSRILGFSDEIGLDTLYRNNSLTLTGWFAAFGLALILILIDIAAVIHKRHKPFFILHETKPRNL